MFLMSSRIGVAPQIAWIVVSGVGDGRVTSILPL